MISHFNFPRLTAQNHRVTSPEDREYNCVAWAAQDTTRWWQPGVYWPGECAQDDYGITALEQAFRSLGYTECVEGSPELGFEKVALYGSGLLYTHAARQLPEGKWTSKLRRDVDIEHDTPEDVAGGLHGEVVTYMKRPAS
jgi:hypothetical protein